MSAEIAELDRLIDEVVAYWHEVSLMLETISGKLETSRDIDSPVTDLIFEEESEARDRADDRLSHIWKLWMSLVAQRKEALHSAYIDFQ